MNNQSATVTVNENDNIIENSILDHTISGHENIIESDELNDIETMFVECENMDMPNNFNNGKSSTQAKKRKRNSVEEV